MSVVDEILDVLRSEFNAEEGSFLLRLRGDLVPQWTSHPNFPRPTPEMYYQDCIERLGDLANWFFRGWHDYSEGDVWTDL